MTISRVVAVAAQDGAREAPDLPLEIGEDAVAPLGAQGVERALEMRLVVEHPLLQPRASLLVPKPRAISSGTLPRLYHLVATADVRSAPRSRRAARLTVNV